MPPRLVSGRTSLPRSKQRLKQVHLRRLTPMSLILTGLCFDKLQARVGALMQPLPLGTLVSSNRCFSRLLELVLVLVLVRLLLHPPHILFLLLFPRVLRCHVSLVSPLVGRLLLLLSLLVLRWLVALVPVLRSHRVTVAVVRCHRHSFHSAQLLLGLSARVWCLKIILLLLACLRHLLPL